MTKLAAVVALVVTLAWAGTGLACGATEVPALALVDAWPEDGESDVPLDAAPILQLSPDPWPGLDALEVSLERVEDGVAVEGAAVSMIM